jgi:peptidoglycan/xylan/chitin deacetylase (PgdA/CDA1 family)
MRRACISIDLDSIYCYQKIFGLATDETDNTIYDLGLARFTELMDEAGFPGTLFCVGRDLAMGDNARTLSELSARGYEIGNHTLNHDYHLTRLSRDQQDAEIAGGREALERATGAAVTGFRAPGYNVTPATLECVLESGHLYDSSVFPCLPYYGTKAAVLAMMRLTGRHSHSILGDARVLTAPLAPYRTQPERWWRRAADGPLWELPITVSPVFRFPFLGSFLILWGERRLPILYKMLKAAGDTLVVEFHGMDFIDGPGDGLDPALIRQPDMRVDWATKRSLFTALFAMIGETCDEVVTLHDACVSLREERPHD